jgi:flagellar hook-basal body complex protein FliE
MDGLTIRGTEQILNQGQTTKNINRVESPIKPEMGGVEKTSHDFASTLKEAVQAVNQAHKDADHKMQELATGKSQNIHETMIAAEKRIFHSDSWCR